MNILNINNGELELEIRGFQEDCRKEVITFNNAQNAADDNKVRYIFSVHLEDSETDTSDLIPYFLTGSINNLSVYTVVDDVNSLVFSTERYASLSTINTTWNPVSGIEIQIVFEKLYLIED